MPFAFELSCTVPANTTEANAITDNVDLPAGAVIDRVDLHVPAGHQALVPTWLQINGRPWIPSDGSKFHLDDTPAYTVLQSPVRLRTNKSVGLAAYNDDDTLPHTVRAVIVGRYQEEVYDWEVVGEA